MRIFLFGKWKKNRIAILVIPSHNGASRLHDSSGGDIYLAFNAHDYVVKVLLPTPPTKRSWFRVVRFFFFFRTYNKTAFHYCMHILNPWITVKETPLLPPTPWCLLVLFKKQIFENITLPTLQNLQSTQDWLTDLTGWEWPCIFVDLNNPNLVSQSYLALERANQFLAEWTKEQSPEQDWTYWK